MGKENQKIFNQRTVLSGVDSLLHLKSFLPILATSECSTIFHLFSKLTLKRRTIRQELCTTTRTTTAVSSPHASATPNHPRGTSSSPSSPTNLPGWPNEDSVWIKHAHRRGHILPLSVLRSCLISYGSGKFYDSSDGNEWRISMVQGRKFGGDQCVWLLSDMRYLFALRWYCWGDYQYKCTLERERGGCCWMGYKELPSSSQGNTKIGGASAVPNAYRILGCVGNICSYHWVSTRSIRNRNAGRKPAEWLSTERRAGRLP